MNRFFFLAVQLFHIALFAAYLDKEPQPKSTDSSIIIIFETHSTTIDNQNELASGWYDIELSALGELQAKELGERYKNRSFDAVFCSDLQRSYRTAEIAFGNKFPIIKDARLRECNYGSLNRASKIIVDSMRETCLHKPFPGGESYEQASMRIKDFLEELFKKYAGKTVLIIGHRATQYGLERWINGITLKDAVLRPWQWQPGWQYRKNER